jgi:hypothetical protein
MGASPYMVGSTLQLKLMQVHALIDLRASHSFIAYRIIDKLHVLPNELNVGVMVGTPLGEYIDIDNVYKG